jgi:NADH-quinone oxidoreductase subunit J
LADDLLVFYAFAALAVASTLLVVVQPNTIYSVLLLIASLVPLAGLYVLLDAPVVAVAQIVVSAGAMMGLFLFVVMLLKAKPEDAGPDDTPVASGVAGWLGALVAMTLALELVWALSRPRGLAVPPGGRDTPWSDYVLAFEVASVLILVAVSGAMMLVGRDRSEKKPWLS